MFNFKTTQPLTETTSKVVSKAQKKNVFFYNHSNHLLRHHNTCGFPTTETIDLQHLANMWFSNHRNHSLKLSESRWYKMEGWQVRQETWHRKKKTEDISSLLTLLTRFILSWKDGRECFIDSLSGCLERQRALVNQTFKKFRNPPSPPHTHCRWRHVNMADTTLLPKRGLMQLFGEVENKVTRAVPKVMSNNFL